MEQHRLRKSGQFHVRRTFQEGQFHSAQDAHVLPASNTLPTFLLKELKAWRLACPKGKHDLVFPNLDGQAHEPRESTAAGLLSSAQKRAGLRRIRFHDLRHTFAEPDDQQRRGHRSRFPRLMGHANASITLNIYSHMKFRASTIPAVIAWPHWFLETKWKQKRNRT